jgi:hypothetical protein
MVVDTYTLGRIYVTEKNLFMAFVEAATKMNNGMI